VQDKAIAEANGSQAARRGSWRDQPNSARRGNCKRTPYCHPAIS
jgi:hypothetical protein